MDVSGKDLARAKHRLSQSRKRAKSKGRGSGPQPTDDRCEPKCDSGLANEFSTQNYHPAVRSHPDCVDLQSLLNTTWTTQSTFHHRHTAMIDSLLQLVTSDSHLIQDDVAKLDLTVLADQLQQYPEYLISGLHPSVTSQVTQGVELASRNGPASDGMTRMPYLAVQTLQDMDNPTEHPRQASTQTTAITTPTAPQNCRASGGSDHPEPITESHQQNENACAAVVVAQAGRRREVTGDIEDAMEDDLDLLLWSSKPGAPCPATGKDGSVKSKPLGRTHIAVQLQGPNQPHPTPPLPRSGAASVRNVSDLEDWLDL